MTFVAFRLLDITGGRVLRHCISNISIRFIYYVCESMQHELLHGANIRVARIGSVQALPHNDWRIARTRDGYGSASSKSTCGTIYKHQCSFQPEYRDFGKLQSNI